MKIAVVGAGYWGPNLIRTLTSLPLGLEVVVCDQDPERLAKAKARFASISTTLDYQEILADPKIEAVVLATPISTHCSLALEAFAAKKHVFVEKPMAGSVKEAEAMVAAATKAERILMVGHTFEYSPPVRRAKELIRAKELGDIYFISMMRVNLGLHQKDASVIWDLMPHDLSILLHWLEERPSRISAVGRDCVAGGIPDVAFVNLTFPSGVIANLEVAWLAPSKLRRIAVVGKRKMLVYDDTENIEKIKIYDQGVEFNDPEDFGEFQLSYRTGDIVSPRLPNTEPLKIEMEHFLECIRLGQQPRSDGASGLEVVRALDAAERSLSLGGLPVSLEES